MLCQRWFEVHGTSTAIRCTRAECCAKQLHLPGTNTESSVRTASLPPGAGQRALPTNLCRESMSSSSRMTCCSLSWVVRLKSCTSHPMLSSVLHIWSSQVVISSLDLVFWHSFSSVMIARSMMSCVKCSGVSRLSITSNMCPATNCRATVRASWLRSSLLCISCTCTRVEALR